MPTPIEVDGEQMMQCNACGNVWDGFAQCNCWQWIDDDDEADDNEADDNEADDMIVLEIDYESDDSGYGGA